MEQTKDGTDKRQKDKQKDSNPGKQLSTPSN